MGTSATELRRIESRPIKQRSSVRKRVSLPTPIQLLPGKEMWLLDLGEGGLSVTGSSKLDIGTVAYARFEFVETNSVIDASGVVAWSDDSGRSGVRFTSIQPDSAAALRRWLKTGALVPADNSNMSSQPDAELATRISCLREVTDLHSAIAAEQLDCTAALHLITRRMMELTRASGAAIALREGEAVVCRASAGNAPDVGVRLSSTSLSGQCLQTGTIVMLEDSENDSRVNPELCRQLNFRSLLVLPIPSGTEIIGIAEVLSPEARNFAGGDILVLSFLADLIASIALPRIEPDENAVPEPTRLLILNEFEPPTVSESNLRPVDLPAILTPPEEIPVVSASQIETEQIASREATEIPAQPIEPEPVEAPTISAATAVAAKLGGTPTMVALTAIPAPRWHEAEATAPEEFASRTPISRLLPIIVTLIVLLATAALLAGYYFSRSSNSAKPSSAAANARTLAPITAAPLPAVSVPTQVDSSAAVATRPQVKPTTGSSQRPVAKSEKASVETPTAELQVIHSASPLPTAKTDNPAPDAPTIATSASREVGPLPTSVTVPRMEAPQLQAPSSQGVTEGKLLKKVLPRYPDMARAAGVSGDVVLSARIGTDGTLHDLKVISGSPLLRSAAIEAAQQWRYSPYKLGGTPVETETRITISFHR